MSALTAPAASTVAFRPLPGRPVAAGRGVAGPVRLTRRGRLLVLALLLVTGLVGLGVLRVPADATAGIGSSAAPVAERVTVRPGETLWQIASRATPGADPRETVARIMTMNGLPTGDVAAGRVLLVPAGG